jgi:hypothetical protein
LIQLIVILLQGFNIPDYRDNFNGFGNHMFIFGLKFKVLSFCSN